MSIFNGSGVALVTPFNEKGVNYPVLGEVLENILNNGVKAVAVCGTTGEPATMSKDERLEVISYCVKKINKRVPVIAGSGGNNTAEACSFSVECEKLGVDGLLVVTPYYNKCTQNGAIAHYTAIANAVNTPIIVYNVPSRTGFNFLPASIKILSEVKNIAAVKEASGNMEQMIELSRLVGDKLDLYSGDDSLTVPAYSIGFKGIISVAANIIPKTIQQICNLCESNDYVGAATLQKKYFPFIKALFSEVNPIPVKKSLEFAGFNVGAPRLPLTEMEKETADKMKKIMLDLQII